MRTSTPAFVIRRVRWSDSSLILTLYSLDFGRISAMARGALRPSGSFHGRMELFSQVDIHLSRREGRELDTAVDISVIDHNGTLRTDPFAFSAAGLFSEWLLAVVSHGNEPSGPVYRLLLEVFSALAEGVSPWAAVCGGVVKLLDLTGHALSLDSCAGCGVHVPLASRWSHADGGVMCGDCSGEGLPVKTGIVSFLSRASVSDLATLGRVGLWRGGYIQCHSLLKDYAEVHLERRLTLKSEKVMKEILDAGQ